MKYLIAVCMLGLATTAQAQAAMVEYDAPPGTTIAQNQSWTPVLYVNNVAVIGTTPTCTGTAAIVCSFPMPNITAAQTPSGSPALTPSGNQTFQLALRDALFGEGGKSAPLVLLRPGAPANLRFK